MTTPLVKSTTDELIEELPSDAFHGDNAQLLRSAASLLAVDARGALGPHGIGQLARDLIASLSRRLAELEEAQRWVPVTERLPAENKKVIVWVNRHGYYPSFIDAAHRQGGRWSSNEGVSYTITHWQPMPESPQ
ncbi:MAG: DUF551 domain-containing protein [Halopseudomonas sp.]|uniref:DUF551 domain-containing protein n=1 Tax=Halopseudomonas sp. TaxID=2901191 RepID=UPI003002540A